MSKSLLLISSDRSDETFAVEAAIAAGLSLVHFPDAESASETLQMESFSAILVDVSDQKKHQLR